MSKRLTVVISTIFAIALLGLGVTAAIQFKSHRAELATSFIFPTAKKLAPFSLKDQHGNLFSNSQLADKWSLFFIGYTSCPDVCPTTMGKLSAAYPELLKNIDLQIIFLSVDPQRDTQEKLLAYMDFLTPNSQQLPVSMLSFFR